MNKLILILGVLFSTNLWAADVLTWDELEANNDYSVAYDIPIDANVTIKAGTQLHFNELIAGEIPVMLFTFGDPNCKDPNFETELALFNPEPEDTAHNKEIGIQYSKECDVDVYVEPQYYYGKSIFTSK